VAKVLNHEDASAQQQRVYRAAPRRGVIDVPKVDADKYSPAVDQSVSEILCKVGSWFPNTPPLPNENPNRCGSTPPNPRLRREGVRA
jgi:hypothetical protein